MSALPDDVVDYLRVLTTVEGGTFIQAGEGHPWSEQADASAHAVLLTASDEASLREAYRVLRPGGHLLLCALSGIGHQGACSAEGMGFEVRDCIFLADSPTDKIHYVAKAPVAEREAGLDHLPETSGEVLEAVDVEDEDEDAGTKKKAKKKRLNTHPTVKPVRLMERLLADVPKGAGPVVDPFLGSGTTGIAALKTGHDFIGVEQEAAYFAIAQARIEHTRRKKGGGGA